MKKTANNNIVSSTMEFSTTPTITGSDGQKLLHFGGYDYLGLRQGSLLTNASISALQKVGWGLGASRVTTGDDPIYCELEQALATYVNCDTAIVLPSGGLTNQSAIRSIAEEVDAWLVDKDVHPSFSLYGLRNVEFYDRNYTDQLSQTVANMASYERIGILTDAIFPISGEKAPIEFLQSLILKQNIKATIVVDEAHSLGVCGEKGRGILAELEIKSITDFEIVITGSLSKALGCFGGFIAGSYSRIENIRSNAVPYRTSTPVPTFIAATALASINILAEDLSPLRKLKNNIAYAVTALRRAGIKTKNTDTPIFTINNVDPACMSNASANFVSAGIFPPLLKGYPNTDSPVSLRFVVTADHTSEDIDLLITTIQSL